MKTENIKFFTKEDYCDNVVRAIVLECHGEEISKGIVSVEMDLLLYECETRKFFFFHDSIVNLINNPRSCEFFDFIANNNIKFDDYEDLAGIVFDATCSLERLGSTVEPILSNWYLVCKLVSDMSFFTNVN